MKITFLGAAKTVTGSCFHIETESNTFLVDCGLFQGHDKEDLLNRKDFPFNAEDLDCIFLTHAHIDHSGRIPKAFLDGFRGEVITTKATAQLCEIMLPDSGHIHEFEADWKNRKRLRSGRKPEPPLYTVKDAIESLKLFKNIAYNRVIEIGTALKARFNDAGHILGSSILELWISENGTETKIVFSGDLGSKGVPILRNPSVISRADYIVVESTYGNRLHREKEDNLMRFMDIICDTVKRGGNVVIPSFAVGRTQEIIYNLNKHIGKYSEKLDRIMKMPVYLDSPLAISATEVFRRNLDCFDREAREYIENGDNPLDFPGLKFTRTAEESIELNRLKESSIIISASGMCEAGRIKHHLKHNLWRPECSVIFVGYQAPGTLGRRIADGAHSVRIFGEEIEVNARIEILDGFSGHADRDGLAGWLKGFETPPESVFIVHGEQDSMAEFSHHIEESLGWNTVIPSMGDSFSIGAKKSRHRKIAQRKKEFRYLEALSMMENLRDELDEVSMVLKDDLKKGMEDNELDILMERLKAIERQFIRVIDD